MHRGLRAALAASAMTLGVAACGSPGGTSDLPAGPGSGTAATAAATPKPSASSAQGQVLAAYRSFWASVVAAHKASDPQLPALAAAAAGPELARVRKSIALNRQQRISLRGTVGHQDESVRLDGATATVEDCYDISAWDPIDVRTGEAIEVTDSGGTGRYRARYTLRRSGGSWAVTNHVVLGGC